jgi:hypothetical protein
MHDRSTVPRSRLSTSLALRFGALALAAVSLTGCTLRGSGTAATETRELGEFEAIDIGGAFELVVHVNPDATPRVEVSGDDNIVPKIITKVAGGELDVSVDHWMVRPDRPLKIEIWARSITEIDASGASDISVEGLHGERFELDLSGASESTLSGAVDHFEVDSSGASDLDARALEAKTVEIDLSGAGDAEVWASEKLDAEVSGAGSVRYFGDPAEVDEDVSGAGKVERG